MCCYLHSHSLMASVLVVSTTMTSPSPYMRLWLPAIPSARFATTLLSEIIPTVHLEPVRFGEVIRAKLKEKWSSQKPLFRNWVAPLFDARHLCRLFLSLRGVLLFSHQIERSFPVNSSPTISSDTESTTRRTVHHVRD